jgi:hypothetical protein
MAKTPDEMGTIREGLVNSLARANDQLTVDFSRLSLANVARAAQTMLAEETAKLLGCVRGSGTEAHEARLQVNLLLGAFGERLAQLHAIGCVLNDMPEVQAAIAAVIPLEQERDRRRAALAQHDADVSSIRQAAHVAREQAIANALAHPTVVEAEREYRKHFPAME